MITRENSVPYDRPMLSKEYMEGAADEESVPLRSKAFYDDHNIELMFQSKVTRVDIPKKLITFENDKTLAYDAILLASGGVPKRLALPGAELKNIFTLRSFEDSKEIVLAAQKASHVGIIGAGFIGMETAHSLTKRNIPVTVISPSETPFQNVLGKEIGKMFQKLHEKAGVRFKMGAKVAKFEGNENVQSVVLENGERIEADLVIVGVGVRPATDFLHGIDLLPDGSLAVDQFFCAAAGCLCRRRYCNLSATAHGRESADRTLADSLAARPRCRAQHGRQEYCLHKCPLLLDKSGRLILPVRRIRKGMG